MSMQELTLYEIKKVKRGVIRNQLWTLKQLIDNLTRSDTDSARDMAAQMLYDVVVSTEWLEKEADRQLLRKAS